MGTKVIIVLNDNGMAISPSVGALSKSLRLVRIDPRYELAKEEAKSIVTRLPLGEPAWALSKEFKNRLKRALIPGAFWERMGFVYIGPVDGHNIREVEAALGRARDYETKPTFVHILTKKGKGHPMAEADAVKFHGVAPNGHNGSKSTASAPSYSEIFGRTTLRLMRENERVVAISAAMLEGTGLADAARKLPKRVFDVGICEQHAVTLAAGMATQGFIPIVAIYSTFLQRAFDQIVHDVCVQELPVVFAIDRAGIVGDDGKTHQGAFDISYLSCIPNMVVAAPKDEDELQHLLYTATQAGRPMAVRYPRGSGRGVPLSPELKDIPLGKGEVLREGRDICILALGPAVYAALDAARQLAQEGIECAVVNARFAKPLDSELILEQASHTGRVVTVEENALDGGFGSAVLQLLNSSEVAGMKTECIGLPDNFIEHGPQELFRSVFDLDAEGIARRIRSRFPELAPRIALKQQKGVNA